MLLKESPSSELPLGKIIAGVIVVFALLGFGINWYSGVANEKRADELYAKAEDDFHRNLLESARVNIDDALKLREKPAYLETKVNVLVNQEKPREADIALDRLIELSPKTAHYRSLSGRMAADAGDLEKAERQFREAVTLEPDNADYKVELANILFDRQADKQATALLEELVRRDPKYKLAWDQYATHYVNAELYPEAITIVNRALEKTPNDSDYYFLLATALDHKGDKQAAANAYLKSLQLEPMKDSIAAKRIFELTGKHVPAALEQMNSERVPFESGSNVMFVNARVNDAAGRFLVDTGASICVVYQSKVKEYHLQPTTLKIEAQTANGKVQAPIAHGSLQLGKHKLNSVVFAILPDPEKRDADGIVGMNFLGKYRMEVDHASQTITLGR